MPHHMLPVRESLLVRTKTGLKQNNKKVFHAYENQRKLGGYTLLRKQVVQALMKGNEGHYLMIEK